MKNITWIPITKDNKIAQCIICKSDILRSNMGYFTLNEHVGGTLKKSSKSKSGQFIKLLFDGWWRCFSFEVCKLETSARCQKPFLFPLKNCF